MPARENMLSKLGMIEEKLTCNAAIEKPTIAK